MRVYLFKLLGVIFILLFSLIANAQPLWESGSINGIISDQSGPQSGYSLNINSKVVPLPLFNEVVHSDVDGAFSIFNVPVGGYMIKILDESGTLIMEREGVINYGGENLIEDFYLN